MQTGDDRGASRSSTASGRAFPMTGTARALNQRFGLYLSDEQQRGLAAGLLLGTVLGGAVLVYGVAAAARRRGR